MAQKTSINIKPCNTGSSEEHNKRKAEYLAHINKERLYIRTDLMASNEAWVAPELGNSSLTDRYNQIARMVKEKTGRAMQTKEREKVNKKTGKVTIVRGRVLWVAVMPLITVDEHLQGCDAPTLFTHLTEMPQLFH